MPAQILEQLGRGTLSAELTCLDYAIAHGANIVNGSFGSAGSRARNSRRQRLHDCGIIMVVAASNDGLSVETANAYPAGSCSTMS